MARDKGKRRASQRRYEERRKASTFVLALRLPLGYKLSGMSAAVKRLIAELDKARLRRAPDAHLPDYILDAALRARDTETDN